MAHEVRTLFADPAMAERFAEMMAAPGAEICGALIHDGDAKCLRTPHGEDKAHMTVIDGSPVQWISADAGEAMPEAGHAPERT